MAHNRGFVALPRLAHRPLRTLAQGLEEMVATGGVVHRAKLETHDLSDAFPGSELAMEPVGVGAMPQQGGWMSELLGVQPSGVRQVAAKGIRPMGPVVDPSYPLADGSLVNPRGFGDLVLQPALLLEVPVLRPSGLLQLEGIGSMHSRLV